MAVKRRSTKNPPVLSHEFVIQNHADIVACIAMVFVAGFMFQVTSPLAYIFVTLNYNVTLPAEPHLNNPPANDGMHYYSSGPMDLANLTFYTLIAIVIHQIIQEYMLDRVNRKLHLSKIKHAKFNESGQLLAFYVGSLVWAGDIVVRENMYVIRDLWDGYPHNTMSSMVKLFFLIQLAYWVHIYPELYFQKVKSEDMPAKIQYATLYLVFIGAAYAFSYTRIALCLIMLQYAVEAVFHACRLLSYADKINAAKPLYKIHDVLFVLARLGSITLAVLTFWYGLPLTPADRQVIDISSRTFNTPLFRLNGLIAVGLLQAWLMWNFITFHLRRMREDASGGNWGGNSSTTGVKTRKTQQEKAKARKERLKKESKDEEDENELTEVDRNTKKSLRQRK